MRIFKLKGLEPLIIEAMKKCGGFSSTAWDLVVDVLRGDDISVDSGIVLNNGEKSSIVVDPYFLGGRVITEIFGNGNSRILMYIEYRMGIVVLTDKNNPLLPEVHGHRCPRWGGGNHELPPCIANARLGIDLQEGTEVCPYCEEVLAISVFPQTSLESWRIQDKHGHTCKERVAHCTECGRAHYGPDPERNQECAELCALYDLSLKWEKEWGEVTPQNALKWGLKKVVPPDHPIEGCLAPLIKKQLSTYVGAEYGTPVFYRRAGAMGLL